MRTCERCCAGTDIHTDVINTRYGNSEDCLYLNVWLPKGVGSTAAPGLPVMLFFHGGSWESGSASSDLYGGDADANMYKNTIIVTANYRLSIYGWLASDVSRLYLSRSWSSRA